MNADVSSGMCAKKKKEREREREREKKRKTVMPIILKGGKLVLSIW